MSAIARVVVAACARRDAVNTPTDQTRAPRGRRTVNPSPVRSSTTPNQIRLDGDEPVRGRFGGDTGTVVVVVVEP